MAERDSLLQDAIRKLELRVVYADHTRGHDNWPHISQAEAQSLLDALSRLEAIEGARKQLAWLEQMERIEQEVFPDARPRSEVIVEVEPDA